MFLEIYFLVDILRELPYIAMEGLVTFRRSFSQGIVFRSRISTVHGSNLKVYLYYHAVTMLSVNRVYVGGSIYNQLDPQSHYQKAPYNP